MDDIRRAHAKLTVTLRITGVRDDGYHLIDAEMVSLDLHDVLNFDPGRSGIATTGPFAHGVPTDTSNLVAQALELCTVEAFVTIDKQIPHGGGLGGGSTDAAATLTWAGHPTDPDSLIRATELGADIGFCLIGGRARVRGIGEIVEPLPHVEEWFTLVVPPLSVPTPAAYRAWDELAARADSSATTGVNDLESAAIAVEPRLARWRDAIAERVGTAPTLAGSGATWFVPGRHSNALADLVDEGATVVPTRTVPADVATNRRDIEADS